jgi:hypothetical protein
MEELKFNKDLIDNQKDSNIIIRNERNQKTLLDLSNDEIQEVFAIGLQSVDRKNEMLDGRKRTIVIPVGFPNAGKTQLISSLLYYAKCSFNPDRSIDIDDRVKEKIYPQFTIEEIDESIGDVNPYAQGRAEMNRLINSYIKGELAGTTPANTLNLIGIDIVPKEAKKRKLPKLNLAFIDIAGEDIKKTKFDFGSRNKGTFTWKFDAVFKGLNDSDHPVVFMLITPFSAVEEDEHINEADLHIDFLNHIRNNYPSLFKRSSFYVFVTQWDKCRNENMTELDFIMKHRKRIYEKLEECRKEYGSVVTYMGYSIGQLSEVIKNEDGSSSIAKLRRINYFCPSVVWNDLYFRCTNKELDKKTIWDKVAGFFK